jgi:hypothetical protein
MGDGSVRCRMGNRRMTRLTNAFSKKAENYIRMMSIYFMHYNFVRIHQTLKVTPAMVQMANRDRELERLLKAERLAFERYDRLRGYPGDVQEAALALWTEATEAVRAHRVKYP